MSGAVRRSGLLEGDARVRGTPAGAGATASGAALAPGERLAIAHVVAPAPFGGLESVVQALAAGQASRGHRSYVLAVDPAAREHPFVSSLRAAGVAVEPIQVGGRAYREERRRVAEFCRAHGIDVLHTHGYRPDVIDSPVARSLGIPRVSTVHGFTGNGWKNRLYEQLQVRAYRRFDAVIAVARSQVGRLRRVGVAEERLHVVPNAWREEEALGAAEARAALGVAPGEFHIGWVGRLSFEKAADQLLHAAALLRDLPFTISFIGAGRQREALEALAQELGIADRVRWHGALEGAGRYFRAFDLFVLSSRTEGTPIVLFEAMGSRVPVVANAVGGVPDVISPEEGLLTESGDPSSLAAAIRRVYEEPEAAAGRAARARARLETVFSLDGWIDRHDEIYRGVVRNASAGVRGGSARGSA